MKSRQTPPQSPATSPHESRSKSQDIPANSRGKMTRRTQPSAPIPESHKPGTGERGTQKQQQRPRIAPEPASGQAEFSPQSWNRRSTPDREPRSLPCEAMARTATSLSRD